MQKGRVSEELESQNLVFEETVFESLQTQKHSCLRALLLSMGSNDTDQPYACCKR